MNFTVSWSWCHIVSPYAWSPGWLLVLRSKWAGLRDPQWEKSELNCICFLSSPVLFMPIFMLLLSLSTRGSVFLLLTVFAYSDFFCLPTQSSCVTLPTVAFWMIIVLTSLSKIVPGSQYYKKLTSYCYMILVHLYSSSRQDYINFMLNSTSVVCRWDTPLFWLEYWHTYEHPLLPCWVWGLQLEQKDFFRIQFLPG